MTDRETMKQKAPSVPCAMRERIRMPKEGLLLRDLLNQAVRSMEGG